MALFELFGWLKYFQEKRAEQKLSQLDLLKQELLQIAMALLVIVLGVGLVVFLIERFLR